MSKPYFILAYYCLTPIEDPHHLIALHKSFFEGRDVTGRIYISEGGINGQMSGAIADAEAYMEWMRVQPLFEKMPFKIHHHHENVFPRMTVKYRKELVAFGREVDLTKQGEHVSPERWKEMMESEEHRLLIDIRNEYEWKVGRFEGSELPPCDTFREFSQYADELAERIDRKKTPVMMCCTGGIRCEIYSSILIEKGFDKVYQLDGGIINYGLKVGSDHWKGKLFVFDDRLTTPISDEETEVIGRCHHCQEPADAYYNCANMDCNCLFICCPKCLHEHVGCCKSECCTSSRLRPYQQENAHKPFRRQMKCGLAKKKS